jgi:outer membrane protein OmpA-like peptidoglycan-associated protein
MDRSLLIRGLCCLVIAARSLTPLQAQETDLAVSVKDVARAGQKALEQLDRHRESLAEHHRLDFGSRMKRRPGTGGPTSAKPSSRTESHEVQPVPMNLVLEDRDVEEIEVPRDERRTRTRPIEVPRIDALIPFRIDSYQLIGEAPGLLRALADLLRSRKDVCMVVNGHTDRATGTYDHNMKLSMLRAASVMAHLIEVERIDPGRLAGHGYGPNLPRFEEGSAQGIQANRRVEFELVPAPGSSAEPATGKSASRKKPSRSRER